MNGKAINQNLHTFLRHLDSINDTLPMTMLLLDPYQKKANKKYLDFLEKNVKEIEVDDGKKGIAVKYEEMKIYESLSKGAEISNLASKIIPESLFVSLISQYDAFLNRLLRILFKIRPEYINDSKRNLTFSQLVEIDSIDAAREYIVEKEVESILRKNHNEHFEYLESILGMQLRKELPIWRTFIEITERRNLFVHCDGIVSNQYRKVCKEHKCEIIDAEIDKSLIVTPEYFYKAYECLYEIATKLTHTIWRKLIKTDLKNADRKLNDICFELINNNQFNLADILLEFACGQKKYFNDAFKNVFVVNRALSKYLQSEEKLAKTIIKSKDWSASRDDFKLANSVLIEDYKKAYDLMKKIGKNGEVDKENYRTWPLFRKIRKEKKFKSVFKELFGEEYNVLDIPKRPLQEIIEEELKNNKELREKMVKKKLSYKQRKEKAESQEEQRNIPNKT